MFSRVAAVLLVLGHLTMIALTFSIPVDLPSLSSFRNATLTLPNGTLSVSRYPPDPYPFAIPNTPLMVTFSRYKGLLPNRAVERAIKAAKDDCIYKAPSAMMPRRRRRYTEPGEERVNLKVTSNYMTWGDWNLVLDALDAFVNRWDAVVLNFRVVDRTHPLRSMGSGYLEDASDDSDSDSES